MNNYGCESEVQRANARKGLMEASGRKDNGSTALSRIHSNLLITLFALGLLSRLSNLFSELFTILLAYHSVFIV